MAARRDDRYRVDGMSCQDGSVVDLSASGAGLVVLEKPSYQIGDRCTLRLRTASQTLRLDARVAWVRREGLVKPVWTMGMQFLDTRPAVRRMLESLAITGHADPRSSQKKAPCAQAGAGAASGADSCSGASGNTGSQDGSRPRAAEATIEPPDLYELLEIEPDADGRSIRAKYHELVRRYHPDSGGGEACPERFSMVSKAYTVLRDPELRERYDQRFGRAAA